MSEGIKQRGTHRGHGGLPRAKILLADEDTKDLQLYASILREQGHMVDCCTTYLEAAERLERGRYDLIILSQGGRAFEGQFLLERAVELDRRRPVLVLTRSVDMRSYLDVMYLGAHDYMEKPPAPWELVETVSHCLSSRVGVA